MRIIFMSLILGIASSFQGYFSISEIKAKMVTIDQSSMRNMEIIPVYNQNYNKVPSLFVHHETKGNQLFIECIVTGISFRESDNTKEKVGKMVVWVDGKRNSEVDSAAFIIKGLSPGSHKLKLEVVKLNNESYGLAKEFTVNIPN